MGFINTQTLAMSILLIRMVTSKTQAWLIIFLIIYIINRNIKLFS